MSDPLVASTKAWQLVSLLAAHGQTVATAESLTGGLLSATLAGIPGASSVLRGGLVVYATDLKASLAGVTPAVLEDLGAVSVRTATELAIGAARTCQSTWGIGITGVAGPEPQEGKEPGTVYIAITRGVTGPVEVLAPRLSGSRWDIRIGSVNAAVDGLLQRLAWISGKN